MTDIELDVSGLAKVYSPHVKIGPISFQVRKGEFFSLLGPSGCGKTTTLRCIAGFETMTEGSILLGGTRLDDKPAHRRGIGLVFQSYALFPHLTIFDNIAFGLKLRRVSKRTIKERVGQMLELVELPELAGRYPAQLSGGQQQRVAIARSLVLEPQLLMFDEPLSNLDFKLRVQMRRELRSLQRRLGKASIYVTHDQTEALALSDRMAVLSHGRIEQIGRPQEIYEAPATAFVADFIGSSNLVKVKVTGVEPSRTLVETQNGLRLSLPPRAEPTGATLLLLLRPERIRIVASDGARTGTNCADARIDEITYLGEDMQLRIHAGGGEPLLVSLKSGKSVRHLAQGGSVRIVIDPDDIHVMQK